LSKIKSLAQPSLLVALALTLASLAGCGQADKAPSPSSGRITDAQLMLAKPAGTNAVIVHARGYGTGTITIAPTGATCEAYDWEDSAHDSQICWAFVSTGTPSVTINASPSSGSKFTGWGVDGCVGSTSTDCVVSMDRDRIVHVGFWPDGATAPRSTYTLRVEVLGFVDGEVTATFIPTIASGQGLACQIFDPGDRVNVRRACSVVVPTGTQVTLTATPRAGTTFSGWGGNCSGEGTCTVVVNRDMGVTAGFGRTGSGGAVTCATSAHRAYDLSADWSDVQNPFPGGAWRLFEAPGQLFTSNMNWGVPGADVPGWVDAQWPATAHVPIWLRVPSGTSIDAGQMPSGTVMVHGAESGRTGTEYSYATWTSPCDGVAVVSGGAWDSKTNDRPMTWSLRRNGVEFTRGDMFLADPYTSSNPFLFTLGSGGPGAVQQTVVAGDTLELWIYRTTTSTWANGVGVNLAVDLYTGAQAVPPVISSFSATPSTIPPGGSSTLSWSVAGATNLSIDHGVGAVSGTSVAVSPTAATTYTLNASNAAGTTSRTLTVTVQAGTSSQPATMAAGGYHTVMIRSDGTLWAWGANGSGQLGDGTTIDRNTPVQVGIEANWHSVSAGWESTLAIKTDGTLWAWGGNTDGQLGDGTIVTRSTPVQIGNATIWRSVVCGARHTIALRTDGTIWAWGHNGYYQLGVGYPPSQSSSTPVQIGTATNWQSVGAGTQHTVAVRTDGTLWSWGSFQFRHAYSPIWIWPSPTQVGVDTDWRSGAAGAYQSIGTKVDGTLWAWGDNAYGQLADGTFTLPLSPVEPVRIGLGVNWRCAASGLAQTLAVRGDGTLWAWGLNDYGQLGDGTFVNKNTPVQIGTATDWHCVAAGETHSVARKADGSIWAWGGNALGQLGDGTTTGRSAPVPVGTSGGAGFSGTFVRTGSMSVDRQDAQVALLTDGRVLVSGGYSYVGATALESAEIFDLAGHFVPTGNLGSAYWGGTATLLPDGTVFVKGGWGTAGAPFSGANKLFFPLSGTFSDLISGTIGGRTGHSATLLASGLLLLAGGEFDTNGAELYDPASRASAPTGGMVAVRYSHSATLLPSGRVLIVGGAQSVPQQAVLGDAEEYDPTTGIFIPLGATLRPRGPRHCATLLPNGKVLLTGSDFDAVAEIFDPATRTFSPTGTMNVGRHGHTATLLQSGLVLITGGGDDRAELYDPATGAFRFTGQMSESRSGHSATLLPDGTVLVAGGTTSSAEIYHP
jgi:alpha-tubulin suppressor-like RCC1 family protein